MPRYRVLEKSFFNDQLCEAGSEIDYDGDPSDNLEPIDDDAKARADDYQQRMAAKAALIVSGVGAKVNDDVVAEIQALMSDLAAAKARIAALEAAPNGANASIAALGARVDGVVNDVHEHDVGLELLLQRVTDVEGTLKALQAQPAAPAPSAPADPAPAQADQPAPSA